MIVTTAFGEKALGSLSLRFQEMLGHYEYACKKFLQEPSVAILDVSADRVYIEFPKKSGLNGALWMHEHMNGLYTYDFDAGDFPVLNFREKIYNTTVMELRCSNNTTHLSRQYLGGKWRGDTVWEILEAK